MSAFNNQRVQKERRALRRSIWGAVMMAALGLGFAIPTSSEAVLLDGVFSLLGGALAVAALRVSTMVLLPDNHRFPFGYAAFEPLLNLVKGLAILMVSALAGYSAVEALLHGGRPIQAGWAVIYGIAAAGGCLAFWVMQRRTFRETGSALVEVDMHNWRIDGAISSVVTLGFAGAALFDFVGLGKWMPYVDPTLVLLVIAATLGVPLAIVARSGRELLLASPELENADELEARLLSLLPSEGVAEVVPRLLRVGRFHYLNLFLLVDESCPLDTLAEQDRLRSELFDALRGDLSHLTLDLLVTRERRWAIDAEGLQPP